MTLSGKRIGVVMTGSFCTFDKVLPAVQELVTWGAEVTPIFSQNMSELDTRFNDAAVAKQKILSICGREPLDTLPEVEPIGPQKLLDLVIVAPCTGNTLAKLALAITDSPALLAIKAHLRNARPVLLAIATNDGLSNNAKNIGYLLNSKHIYFVPFGQDGAFTKQNSLQARFSLIAPAAEAALEGKQLQPVLLGAGECLLGEEKKG